MNGPQFFQRRDTEKNTYCFKEIFLDFVAENSAKKINALFVLNTTN